MENERTDKDILLFISENPELGDLLSQLENEVTTKTVKWRNDRKAARLKIVSSMADRGLHGNYKGIKQYLNTNIAMLQHVGDVLGVNNAPKKRRCCGF